MQKRDVRRGANSVVGRPVRVINRPEVKRSATGKTSNASKKFHSEIPAELLDSRRSLDAQAFPFFPSEEKAMQARRTQGRRGQARPGDRWTSCYKEGRGCPRENKDRCQTRRRESNTRYSHCLKTFILKAFSDGPRMMSVSKEKIIPPQRRIFLKKFPSIS